jgi:fumarate hydratase subunit beta
MIEYINTGKKEEIPREILDNKVVFHCGPVVKKENENWIACATGPTTSSKFTGDGAFLAEHGIFNVAIGKGTMGKKTRDALYGRGVYLVATGGCAILYKKHITKTDVKWLDLGYPEAVWIFDVNHFGPLTVSIDSNGNSLTEKVMNDVYENARQVYKDEGLNPHERYVQYPRSLAGQSLEEVIELAKTL